VSDLNFDQSGCEPARGPRAVVVTARRGARMLLRPMFARLVEILTSVVSRLDRAEALIGVSLEKIDAGGARLDAAETRIDAAERADATLDTRTHGLAAHLAGLNDEHVALHADVRRLQDVPPRVADCESRLASAGAEIHAGKVRLGRTEALIGVGLEKIDAVGARLDGGESRLAAAERQVTILDTRTLGLAAHLAGLNDEHLALQASVRDNPSRISAAEARLDSFDWHAAVLHPRTEGLAAHLAGLSDDHRGLHTEVQARIVQLTALSGSVSDLGRRQDELDEKLGGVQALHWDHVALARRLAVIEDLLATRSGADGGEARPSVPFPGLGDDESRSRVG